MHTPRSAARFRPHRTGMDFSVRDSSYHRRLAVISTMVVVGMGLVLVAGQHYTRSVNPEYVGWQGAMELLPELTVEPEAVIGEPSRGATPARKKEASSMPTLAPDSELRLATSHPEQFRVSDTDALDVQPHGASVAEKVAMSRPISYSETFVILRSPPPVYPEDARRKGIEGKVEVELLIDEEGRVAQASALNLIGPMSFQDAALDAARQFLFKPPIVDGEPSTMWIKFVFTFDLPELPGSVTR